MRNFAVILSLLLAAACSSGDGGSAECSLEGQKQFVLDSMRDWYFWNASLPAEVDIGQFHGPAPHACRSARRTVNSGGFLSV